jgi:ComF family protein
MVLKLRPVTVAAAVMSVDGWFSENVEDPEPAQSRSLANRAHGLARTALDLVFPPVCLGCETRLVDHDALCPACWRRIDFIRAPLCDRLGIPLPYDTGGTMISAAAAADPPDYGRARAVARFDGLMRDLIHTLKFADTHDGRRLFGRWLVTAGGGIVSDAGLLIPVPLARWRLLTRRYNQAQILAAEVGRMAGKPVAPMALVRARRTRPQVGLSRAERKRNVSGAFIVPPEAIPLVAGKAVVLVDDVITTGATVSAAARALKRAGAARVDVLALGLVCEPGAFG